jgi:glycosyltransferase involved in cell wall biosynthesis
LISALPSLISEKPDVQVLIIGDGPYKPELMALTDRLGVGDHVAIRGIPPSDRTGMANILARATLVVLLSDYEAHPVAVMEALALRRRVLVADGSGLRELVDHDASTARPRHSRLPAPYWLRWRRARCRRRWPSQAGKTAPKGWPPPTTKCCIAKPNQHEGLSL